MATKSKSKKTKASPKTAKKTMATKSKSKKTKASPKTAKKTKTSRKQSRSDIIELILKDHKPLWKLIKTMKSEKASYADKKDAFDEFAPTLIAHAKPEEQTWYISMKEEHDMNVEGLEGDVEHALADQLCNELKSEDQEDPFMAKVKVLAELVEHHLEEEEEDLLPDFKKNSTPEERDELGKRYLELKTQFTTHEDSKDEAEILTESIVAAKTKQASKDRPASNLRN